MSKFPVSYSQYEVGVKTLLSAKEGASHDVSQDTTGTGGAGGISSRVNPDDVTTGGRCPAVLQRLKQGILTGESPLQFSDAIDTANSAVGNQAFIQFVKGLYRQDQDKDIHGIAEAGISGPGKPLTHRHTLQRVFGHHDISSMREYSGAGAETALAVLGAEGYCRGGRMAVKKGVDLYAQAHEAAHGVQQAGLGGSLQSRPGVGGGVDKYEQHADAVAGNVMRGESAEGLLDQVAGGHETRVVPVPAAGAGVVQMMDKPRKDKAKKTEEISGEAGGKSSATAATPVFEEAEVKSKPKPAITKPDEFIAAVTGLVESVSQPELTGSHGALTSLSGYDHTGLETAPGDLAPLFDVYSKSFMNRSKGGKVFPEDFNKALILEFRNQVTKYIKGQKKAKETAEKRAQSTPGEKTQEKKPKRKGEEQKGKEMKNVNDIPGLEGMFLCRGINHLIMVELHALDSMVGDEGCQLRTPFILDMCRLVNETVPDNAVELVTGYREKAESEQTMVFDTLRSMENLRKAAAEAKIESDRLKKEAEVAMRAARKSRTPVDGTAQEAAEKAKSLYERKEKEYKTVLHGIKLTQTERAFSGGYKEMVIDLTGKMGNKWADYLTLTSSEGAIYWEDLYDDFGIAVSTNYHPVFPDQTLSKRKARQSELSRDYMVDVASRLVKNKGTEVHDEQRTTAYTMDKSGSGEKQKTVKMAKTRQNDILSQLLYSIQLCSAVIPRQKENIQLIQCWEAMRVVFSHMHDRGYPIIINLRRLVASPAAAATGAAAPGWEYRSVLCRTLFYAPTPTGYKYVADPDKQQERQGGFCVTGYSMLRQGDETLGPAAAPLPNVASWVFEQDPEKFLRQFSAADILNLLLFGITKHPPLNVGAEGTRADALTEEIAKTSKKGDYRFDRKNADDAGGWRYADDVHSRVLAELGGAALSEDAQTWLTPEYQLTDKARGLMFPNACPINLAGGGVKLNIKEEYQLLLRLSEAAGIEDLRYSEETKKGKTAKRLPGKTIPFSIVHVYASTYEHEDKLSRRYAQRSKGKTAGELQDLESLRKQM